MAELLSVGLDVGTTSTQMVVSALTVENRAGSFAVPEMEIAARRILYKSPVHFTPLLDENRVDAARLREIVDAEYQNAGIRRADVDTGAIIITGETSRKENARAVLEALSDYAGEFVVTTAGPDLESVLAARGSGAVEFSKQTGKSVLHMDIGGGTSNLALIEDGNVTATGCLNVGGRLLKHDGQRLAYVSPVLDGIFSQKPGDYVNQKALTQLANTLTQALEMAAGLREPNELLAQLWTTETGTHAPTVLVNEGKKVVISFSGGVADCIEREHSWDAFGDMGPALGQAIRRSRLCRGEYTLGAETIRATVIGAGCHSTQLSGSTVFHQNIDFPLKNLPVVHRIEALARLDGPGILALTGTESPSYAQIRATAAELAPLAGDGPLLIALEADMAKALGQQLALRLGRTAQILCLDRVRLGEQSYLDVGSPIGPAIPVVVKTLIFNT